MFKNVSGNPVLVVLWLILFIILIFIIIICNEIKSLFKNQKDNKADRTGENCDGCANRGRSYDKAPRGEKRMTITTAQATARISQTQEVRPRITINRETTYRPERLSNPFHFPGKTANPQNGNRRYLILEKRAYTKLKDELDWGRKTRRNCVEQGGILLGRAAFYGNEIYCFVKDILLADTLGDPVFVELSREMWAAMQNRFDEINASLDDDKKLAIVGWFHTHPNGLAVFMSGTDMKTQRLNFSQEWQVSLVMNPHTDRYRAFFGANAIGGKIVFPENFR